MKKTAFLSILLILVSACSKIEVVELPITTTNLKALDYYKKAYEYDSENQQLKNKAFPD